MSYANVFDALGFDTEDATVEALRSDLAAILRTWMKREHLNQVAAGRRLGVPQSVISKIVNGQTGRISVEYMIRLLAKAQVPWTAKCWKAPEDACVIEGQPPVSWIAGGTATVESRFIPAGAAYVRLGPQRFDTRAAGLAEAGNG